MVLDEPLERLELQQWHVGGQHEQRPGGRTCALRLQHRVAGAEPLALLDRRHAVARQRAHAVGVGADDQDDAIGEGLGQAQGIGDQGTTAELVQDLGRPGAHALALTGSQDDRGQSVHAASLILTKGLRGPCHIGARPMMGVPASNVDVLTHPG